MRPEPPGASTSARPDANGPVSERTQKGGSGRSHCRPSCFWPAGWAGRRADLAGPRRDMQAIAGKTDQPAEQARTPGRFGAKRLRDADRHHLVLKLTALGLGNEQIVFG